MKKLLLSGMSAVSVVLICFGAASSSAKPVKCLLGEERIALFPTGVVTSDGLIIQRVASGLYQTDAGVEFNVNGTELTAVDPITEACTSSATAMRISVTDPFTGFSGVVEAVTP